MSDFFFVFGVLVLGWNPILLILWYMIDQAIMGGFVIALFHKENAVGCLSSISTVVIVMLFVSTMVPIYDVLATSYIEDIEMEDLINADPSQIFNPVIFPILVVFSYLAHHNEYQQELTAIDDGTYEKHMVIHFFIRHFSLLIMIMLMLLAFLIFWNFYAGILITLVSAKAFLRIYNQKWRGWI